MDVIGSHQAGVEQVVATAGTAMTTYHLQTLKRLTSTIKLCFDSDRAGQAATERAIGLAQSTGVNLYIISLPDGFKDPDELAAKDAAAWAASIDKAQYVIDWVIAHYQQSSDISTARGKREFSDQALKVLGALQDPVEQSHYVTEVAQLLGVTQESLRRKLSANTKQPLAKKAIKPNTEAIPETQVFQDDLLALGLAYVETREVFENVPATIFDGEDRQKLAESLQKNRTDYQNMELESAKDLPIDVNYAKILLFKAEHLYNDLQAHERLETAYSLKRRLLTQVRKTQQQTLTSRIQAAEQSGDHELARTLLQEYQRLLQS